VWVIAVPWERSSKRRRHRNGWLRLWIFVSALWVALVAVTFALGYPTWQDSDFDAAIAALSPHDRALVISTNDARPGVEGNRVQYPSGHTVVLRPGISVQQWNELNGRIEHTIAQGLAGRRWRWAGGLLLVALLPCLAVYGIGLATARAIRGFRHSKTGVVPRA
jgi:hypothetical protein